MSDGGEKEIFLAWFSEARDEIRRNRDEISSLHKRFERLDTEVRTRNRILWALIGLLVAASGTIVTISELIIHK